MISHICQDVFILRLWITTAALFESTFSLLLPDVSLLSLSVEVILRNIFAFIMALLLFNAPKIKQVTVILLCTPKQYSFTKKSLK